MQQQHVEKPRTPGVKYEKVRRFRLETTEIDGAASTRSVPYDGWEPVPPRDWDEVVMRGVATVALGFTCVAVVATTASVGKLVGPLVPDPVAYAGAALFPMAWVFFTSVEWLNRTCPERARPAQIGGWITLALSMAAVFAYGHTIGAPWAGGFGAGIDLLAKVFCWMFLRQYAVPLDPGVAHWLTDQEQKFASRALLGARLRRLNRTAAYQQAVGGAEQQAAHAILSSVEQAPAPLQAPPREPAPEPVPVAVPAAPVAPVVQVVHAPDAQQTAPAAPAPPVVQYVQPPAPPAPAAAPETAPNPGISVPSVPSVPHPAVAGAPVPPVTDITRPAIAAICREAIKGNPTVTDAELLTLVLAAGHEDRPNLADTVRRSALRIDPSRKAS